MESYGYATELEYVDDFIPHIANTRKNLLLPHKAAHKRMKRWNFCCLLFVR
ncbi:hypothetical protein [uncultured Helicobacter sp.]|uniref:hypothetical protein n=1 Tax=uncultured Helicobacter sp. TaxID=175537 RepID=UPI002601D2FD|nr:hypothetical protein [uncultured Helicobacter sp.]